ncbi:hypothetical protein D9756_009743 [Leucocoprinus leucothites]|uniref:Uncharacterized protein n=1 Tax=Leucocoprinus leucothites TaxID=201217 RepID=A0A8H5FT64_9AGAR|nr:hypothetical protein D9756_009743 [Leucoagaricus leucothites]
MSEQKNPERVAAGLKATVHNAKTSEEAKLNAAQRLDDMGVEIEQPASTHKAGTGAPATGEFRKGGYTTLDYTDNPKEADVGIPRHQMGTSTSTKTRKISGYAGMDVDNSLDDDDPETFDNIGRSRGAQGGQPGEAREMGGYRATLKNPRVSEQAKEHAREVLEEHDEPLSTR